MKPPQYIAILGNVQAMSQDTSSSVRVSGCWALQNNRAQQPSNDLALSDLFAFMFWVLVILVVLVAHKVLRRGRCSLAQALASLRDFFLLLCLFVFIFIILGMQLFGGSPVYNPAQTQSWRKNFNSFWEAFYAVSSSEPCWLSSVEQINRVLMRLRAPYACSIQGL